MAANVALFGRFCAGKTTLANALVDLGYEKVSMAANMKNLMLEVYGTVNKQDTITVTRRDGTNDIISVRAGLQGLGESVKSFDRDFWLTWMLADTQWMKGPLVMDDARLLFEAEALKARGWLLVKVETPDSIREERHLRLYGRVPTDEERNHTTESQLDLVTFDLVVDGVTTPEVVADAIAAIAGLEE